MKNAKELSVKEMRKINGGGAMVLCWYGCRKSLRIIHTHLWIGVVGK